ncbi:MAG TPA: YdeI/OmpD-associated family protein [Acidobacteriaceae bacterium]|nr:YdeI/OmpD-associated family protein [Acidobacteriaceae bacterium]
MSGRDKRVDAYIAKSADFAKPILEHVRELVHIGCPDVIEDIKWGRPFFLHAGVILLNVAAFKEHCSVGFWGAEMSKVLRTDSAVQDGAMGSFGKITSLKDLPPDKKFLAHIKQAGKFVDEGNGKTVMAASQRVVKAPKPPVEAPPEFLRALKKSKAAGKVFDAFSPSCKREYIEWIAEAKRPETRDRRIAQAIEWIAEGKQRNWKYQNC